MDRFQELFNRYIDPKEISKISDEIAEITKQEYDKRQIRQAFSVLLGCVDLTSLESTDSKESVWALAERVNKMDDGNPSLPHIASICVYPNLIATAGEALMSEGVKLCAVTGGFPSGQTFVEVKIAETALAVADGAEEIDMVMNVGNFLNEDYEEVVSEIEEVKTSCRESLLKVILETGALKEPATIAKASIIAMYSGTDFIKTSTGKIYPGASLEAVYVMCLMAKKYYEIHGRRIGIKVAGGIKTVDEALNFYKIVEKVLGKEWLNDAHFRIGTSRLLESIIEAIEA